MVFLLIVNKKLIIIYKLFFSNGRSIDSKASIKDDNLNYFFKETKLKITGFIKSIGDRIFYKNSKNSFLSSKEIISINFLEGIEEIGSESFYKCDDLTNKTIKLPSSIQHIGDKVFSETNLEVLDLSNKY